MTTIIKIDSKQSISRLNCVLPEGITGIGYSQTEQSVVFYRCQDGLFGFVDDSGNVKTASRRLEVVHPVGICCDNSRIFVFQFSKDMLWTFDTSYQTGHGLLGAGTFKNLSRTIPEEASKLAPYGMCANASNKVFVAMPWGNKILAFNEQGFVSKMGSGKAGFSSSNHVEVAMFNTPSGVCFDKGSGFLFVSDTGNSIVRIFSNNREIGFVGLPGVKGSKDGIGLSARFSQPSSIRAYRGFIVLVDGNLIRTFKAGTLDTTTIYASANRIVDIAIGGESVYVMEETT